MGQLDRVSAPLRAAALACLWLSGCTSEQPAPTPAPRQAAVARTPENEGKPPPADERFDASGQLLPSGIRLSWLELPRGFRALPGANAREASYEATNMPLAKARAYFEARLVPERVEYPPGGVTFHRARPSYTRLEMPAIDVRLRELEGSGGTLRLMIDDLGPSGAPPMSPEVAARELERRRSRME